MKKMTGSTESVRRLIAIAGLFLICLAMQSPAIQGTIIKAADGRPMNGDIRWKAASKQYAITAGGVSMTLTPAQVKEVRVPKPATLDQALAALKGKRYDAALAEFEKIMETYKMLQWDVPATGYAARAHLGLGNAAKAATLCEKLIRDNPGAAYQGELAAVYWQALIDADREATLRQILDRAAEQGPRELAALAQIRRGDIDMKNGKFKDALVDGYLRTVVLFDGVKQYQPEALYKAARCFEQLNETGNAEKMRKRLLESFPESSYAQQVQMGK